MSQAANIPGGTSADQTPAWRRYAGPLLLGSLALNLLLIGGTLGGHFAAHRHGGGMSHQPIERGIVGFVRTLPRDRAQVLMQSFESQRPLFKEHRRAWREARGAAFDAFTAETVEPDRLRAALNKAGEAEDRMQALGTTLFVDLAAHMTPAERRAYRVWREAQDKDHRDKRREK